MIFRVILNVLFSDNVLHNKCSLSLMILLALSTFSFLRTFILIVSLLFHRQISRAVLITDRSVLPSESDQQVLSCFLLYSHLFVLSFVCCCCFFFVHLLVFLFVCSCICLFIFLFSFVCAFFQLFVFSFVQLFYLFVYSFDLLFVNSFGCSYFHLFFFCFCLLICSFF